ncbi:MAG: hypothetical protein H0A75_07490 [Candidatus Methanofishera endochildressiae]|uniref:Uncharacterized protein n=1 Tax=Candidatus Methanofishera endochildressiae TaxID=2738884 RepID=A0A7Z0MPG9_9GAMM|nr:hypothetical protein [Candidatus Methanofishera endochildressiae]
MASEPIGNNVVLLIVGWLWKVQSNSKFSEHSIGFYLAYGSVSIENLPVNSRDTGNLVNDADLQ